MNNGQSIVNTRHLLLEELEFETTSTSKLLQRIPEDKLSWKPHEKAMPLGVLAFHLANIPGNILSFADQGKTKVEDFLYYQIPSSKREILESFPNSIAKAKQVLERTTVNWYNTNWELLKDGKSIFTISRLLMCRLLVFNHWYHHRGQLVTYLRELDVPVPSIYGPSYDENPFEQI